METKKIHETETQDEKLRDSLFNAPQEVKKKKNLFM